MKTLTVQEASQNLGRWLRRAMSGEQIAIHEERVWCYCSRFPRCRNRPRLNG